MLGRASIAVRLLGPALGEKPYRGLCRGPQPLPSPAHALVAPTVPSLPWGQARDVFLAPKSFGKIKGEKPFACGTLPRRINAIPLRELFLNNL